MNPMLINPAQSRELSHAARLRMFQVKGEPLFHNDWLRVVFIHYEVDPEALQREVPFPLDLDDGKAYLSLVAFTMRDMRPRLGGRLTALLLKPIATHKFLNVRAYVKHRGETGIYFLVEWLSNPLSLLLGPRSFGLPYECARLQYHHRHERGELRGTVSMPGSPHRLAYACKINPQDEFQPCAAGSREEFLIERYTAFTQRNSRRRHFRIWHPPWPQASLDVSMLDESLLAARWPMFRDAVVIGANYSPGIRDVWMGRPHKIRA